jgi:hypothetical protein
MARALILVPVGSRGEFWSSLSLTIDPDRMPAPVQLDTIALLLCDAVASAPLNVHTDLARQHGARWVYAPSGCLGTLQRAAIHAKTGCEALFEPFEDNLPGGRAVPLRLRLALFALGHLPALLDAEGGA